VPQVGIAERGVESNLKRLRRNRRNELLKCESIFDRKAICIVVEIDKYDLIFLYPTLDFFTPLA